MSIIEMSPVFGLESAKRMIGYPSGVNISNIAQSTLINGYAGTMSPSGSIKIMKGVIPVDFNELLLATSRQNDTLLDYPHPYFNGSVIINAYGPINTSNNPVIITTDYHAAGASGTATWFWIYRNDLNNPRNILQQIIGTVGAVGSGADLEIPDTNLLAGVPYRITNLKLQFPTVWNY